MSPRATMELIKNYKEGKLSTADIRCLNNTIICLMALIAVTSIVWSITIHIISGDLGNGFLGAKLHFYERNFHDMDNKTKTLFNHDLQEILTETYKEKSDGETIISMRQSTDELETSTKPPGKAILAHLLQVSSSAEDETPMDEQPKEETVQDMEPSPTVIPVDFEADKKFLSTMSIDPHQTMWSQSPAVQFVYSFSFLSEIIAIIWAAMCMVFQSGVKKYWGLPKPWRIVVPSILMFTVMSVGSLVYTILANQYIKDLCRELRDPLTAPSAISCVNAFTLLRPVVRKHVLSHEAYLGLFKICYTFSLVLWSLALIVMVLRYLLAIDFQLAEIEAPKHQDEFIEVSLNSPKHHHHHQQQTLNLLPSSSNRTTRSEEDFHSAKTHLSEAVTPLLQPKNIQHM